MGKYLDKSGLRYFYGKLKEKFADKTTIEAKLDSLTGAFLWKGKFDTLPPVYDYEAGNVVAVGKKEYVLTVTGGTKTWEEFGDEGSYLLKTAAEETYLKKAAGEVKTANLADNAVTSTKLAKGARKPIIITEDMTEVDEETYQKLSQEGTDVILSLGGGTFVELQGIFNTGDTLNLIFGYSQFDESNDGVIATYTITINTSAPHTLTLAVIGTCEPVSKSILSPVLQEIDLTGTDAERKAKLDQFETDWKALTGASDLTGARFVGKFVITDDVERNITGIMTYSAGDTATEANDNCFYGICNGYSFSEQKSQIAVKVSCKDGSLTITPLFSHLEAITIYTDNTPEHKQANLDNIAAYEANLQALGVDVTKGYIIPITASGRNGFLSTRRGDYPYAGYAAADSSVNEFYNILILGNGEYYDSKIQPEVSDELHTISKQIVGAINEINANAVHSDKLVPTLEAITIKTGNTPESKAANVAAIKAYVDNLEALGVDVTKGYMIPIRSSSEENTVGFIIPNTTDTGYVGLGEIGNGNGITLYISNDGNVSRYRLQEKSDDDLTTTTNNIVGAINEVNALAKSKQDALTSGTNIKTVNGQSLLGSGDIAISGGGGSAPVLVDIDDITGSAGVSVPVDVFNKIANAASAKTPIFGYSKLVNGPRTTYEIIPLCVKHVSTTGTNDSLSIQFIAENAYNSIGIMKRSDTDCSILISSSRPFALDTSVDKSSTRGIQSSAVWNEIHSEPMTINTATSGVTTLSSTDKHKILCYADSGTQQYNLPSSPVDGETFLFLKVKSSHEITIQSGTGNENIYDCSSGNSVVSKTIVSSTKSKITVTYSSTVGKWFLMADDFIS